MSDTAIQVETLSKLYRIGMQEQIHDTFAGAMLSWAKAPLRNSQQLRKLCTFSPNLDGEDLICALRNVSVEVK